MHTTQQNAVRLSRKTLTPLVTVTEELYSVQLNDGTSYNILYTKEVYGGKYDKRSAVLAGGYKKVQRQTSDKPCGQIPSVVKRLIAELNSGCEQTHGVTSKSLEKEVWVRWNRVLSLPDHPEVPL